MSFSILLIEVHGCVDDKVLEKVCPGGKVRFDGWNEMYKEYVNIAVSVRQLKPTFPVEACFKGAGSIINQINKK